MNIRRVSLLALWLLGLAPVAALAQEREAAAPKWAAKAQKAIVSVLTYDKNNELLRSGTGVYVGGDGTAIADYALFRGAHSGVVVDQGGRRAPVERVLGADDAYGVVLFSVGVKKTPALPAASPARAGEGARVYALGFSKGRVATCPSATIEKKDVVEEKYAYYTLSPAFDDKYTGAALFAEDGSLLGLVQSPIGGRSYAMDAGFGKDLSIAAIQTKSASRALGNIFLRKGLPKTVEEALVYLYFKSRSADNEEYLDLLDLFVQTYPSNAEGYYRRATPLADLHRFDEADSDLQAYLRLADDKSAAHAKVAQVMYTKLLYQPEPKYDKWTYDLAIAHIDQAIGETQAVAGDGDAEARVLGYRLEKAQMLVAKKDYRAALAIYDEVNAGPHRAPATYYAASLAHEAAGDSLAVQIEMMDSALALFPAPVPKEAAGYVMRRGQLYAAAGKYRHAVLDYNQYCYLSNNKVNANFYYDRSQLEVKARMFQQALDDIGLAIQHAPQEPLYLVEKSAILLRVNMLDECVAAARQCLALDGEMPDAYRIMGYALIQKGEKAQARECLEKAVSLGDETARELIETYLK